MVYTVGLFFISLILTILAVAVQETFKSTVSSTGSQECGAFAELCVKGNILTVLCVAMGTEQARCHEPQYLACSLPGTRHLNKLIWETAIRASAL